MSSSAKRYWLTLTIIGNYLLLNSVLAMGGSVTVSWDPNTESDLSGYIVYMGASSGNYSDAVDVGNQTSFAWANLDDNKTYYFAVTAYDLSGNESDFSAEVAAAIPPPNNGDSTPPTLAAVVIQGETQVDAIFSEAVEEASAETSSNYSISDGIQIQGVVLDADGRTVHLVTSAHQLNKNYTLIVANVKDVNGNAIASGNSGTYLLPGDTTAPEFLNVAVIDESHITLVFSEILEQNSAQASQNYSISDGVQVLSASLSGIGTTVDLTTSPHESNRNYTVTVSSVADVAGNAVADGSSMSYLSPTLSQDVTGPSVAQIIVLDQTQVDVAFSETIEEASAQNAGNYSISDGIVVHGVTLDADGRTAHIVTSAHEYDKTYTLTISNIKDLSGNNITSGTFGSYLLPLVEENDTTPPEFLHVDVEDEAHITLVFNETLNHASAAQVGNYVISGAVQVLSANLGANATSVHLVTTSHQSSTNYTITVSNLTDAAGNPIVPGSRSYVSVTIEQDITPPQLAYVASVDANHVDVVFTESLDKISAETAGNYAINNGVQVASATFAQNGTTVRLTTSTHQGNQQYTLSVINVADLSGNKVAAGSLKSYTVAATDADQTPPQLIYVTAVDATHIDVVFSEAMNKEKAEDPNNYGISNSIQIQQAELQSSQSVVRLTTSEHQNGVSYKLTVSNVTDNADSPNAIQANSSYSYQFVGNANAATDVTPPTLLSVEVKGSTQIDVLFSEPLAAQQAQDKNNYKIVPEVEILGAVLDANLTTVHLITASHLVETDYTITISNITDRAGNPNMIDANSGTTYNVNSNPGDDTAGGSDNAVVPETFSLFQNFPNPFNPETEIKFFLDEDRDVLLKIYNPLGQLVRELVNDETPAGFHTVKWDGKDQHGTQMASGVYIYALEIKKNIVKGNMLVDVSLERRVRRMTLLR